MRFFGGEDKITENRKREGTALFLSGLDDTDRRIVELLIRNARMSYSDLGEAVGLSRVAVKARIRALEERGVIKHPQKFALITS